ncbi:MAG: DUF2178 domain-containing protein [Methanobacteriota archaeon]
MDKTAQDKVRVIALIGVSLAVITSAVAWAMFDGLLDDSIVAATTFIIVGIAALIMIFIGGSMVRNIKAGLPVDDERSQRIKEKAASNSFIFLIYLMLALGLYCDSVNSTLKATDITGISILGGAISFVAMWAYFSRMPSLD